MMSSLEPEIARQMLYGTIFSCIRNGGKAGKLNYDVVTFFVHCEERELSCTF